MTILTLAPDILLHHTTHWTLFIHQNSITGSVYTSEPL